MIKAYKVKQLVGGVTKTITNYYVAAEGINKHTGRRVQKNKTNITSLPKAKEVYNELWYQCRNEKPAYLKIETWGQLLQSYLEDFTSQVRSEGKDGFSPKVLANKKSRLSHLASWDQKHILSITQKDVVETLDLLEQSKSLSRELTCEILKEIKAVLNYAVTIGVLEKNPLAKLKRKKPRKIQKCLTLEEANKLLFEARKQNHPYYLVWLLSIFTGLRRSELAGLKWTDLDYVHRLAYVGRQLIPGEGLVDSTKEDEDKIVPLHPDLIPVLKEYQLKRKSDFVINLDDKSWKNGSQSFVLKKFCKEIGIKDVTHHQLRATFITLALADNVPLGLVSAIVGHRKLATTDRYFRKSGLNIKGRTDELSLKVPFLGTGNVVDFKSVKGLNN